MCCFCYFFLLILMDAKWDLNKQKQRWLLLALRETPWGRASKCPALKLGAQPPGRQGDAPSWGMGVSDHVL